MSKISGGGFGRAGLRGLGGGFGNKLDTKFICPMCNYQESHKIAFQINSKKCPKCGAFMIRA